MDDFADEEPTVVEPYQTIEEVNTARWRKLTRDLPGRTPTLPLGSKANRVVLKLD